MLGFDYPNIEPCGLSKKSIDSLAESVAKQLYFGAGDDIKLALNKLGGNLVIKNFWDLGDDVCSSMCAHGLGHFDIFVPSNVFGSRDRFTIAHEIGHYVLHFLWPRNKGERIENVYASRYCHGREAWEANWFALGLLMSRQEFKYIFEHCGCRIADTADAFGVTLEAATYRANYLGLI